MQNLKPTNTKLGNIQSATTSQSADIESESDLIQPNFLDYFKNIKDPRIERNKLYPIEEILLITICGVICGAEGWADLVLFGEKKIDYLRTILPFKNNIATDDTFRRFFRSVDPKQFKDCFINWVQALQNNNLGNNLKSDEEPQEKFVAIDGKTLRRSYDKATNMNAIHMVSAWCGEQSMVLGQFKTEEKSNEITAIPELLNLLSIDGATITIDAMGCQKKIAKKIIDQKADYVLAVKDNQPTLHQEIIDFFSRHKSLKYKGQGYEFKQYEEVDKGHGRIEIRKYTAIDQILWMNSGKDWEGLKSIVMVESTRIIGDKTTIETRYFISSLPANIAKLSKAIRSHWGIENSLHWVLDVTFNEDQSRIRKGNAPQNIAMVRHVALNLLKQAQKRMKGVSIKALRKAAGWDNKTMSVVLGFDMR